MNKANLHEFYKSLDNLGIFDETVKKDIKDFAEQLKNINRIYQMYFPTKDLALRSLGKIMSGKLPEKEDVLRSFDMNRAQFEKSRVKHDLTEDIIEIAYHAVTQRACYPEEKGNPLNGLYTATDKGYANLIECGRIGWQCIGQDSRSVNRIKAITPESEKYLEQIIYAYNKRSENLDEICTMRSKNFEFSSILEMAEKKGIISLSPRYGFDIFSYFAVQSGINRLRAGMIQYKINELKQKNIDPNWNIFLGKY